MKPNVDLTIDRKFRNRNATSPVRRMSLLKSLLKAYSNERFPWAINVSRISSTLIKTNALLYTGNKKERLHKKENFEYENGTFCDCCGVRLDKKPWKKGLYLLCAECDLSLNKGHQRTYWLEEKGRFVKVRTSQSNSNASTETDVISALDLIFENNNI